MIVAGLLLAAFAVLTLLLAGGFLHTADVAVADAFAGLPEPARIAAHILNHLGQGGWVLMPLAAVLAVRLARRTRSIRPLLLVGGAALLAYATVKPVKLWTERAAPASPMPDRVELFNPAWAGLSDAVAGVLLGLVLLRLVRRVPWDSLPLPRQLGSWRGPALLVSRPRRQRA